MKLFKFFTFVALTLLFASCGTRGSSNRSGAKPTEFWEGSVKPGTYHISWNQTVLPELPRVKHTLEIVIFDNHEYELREKQDNGYHSDITTMTGFVKKKHEMYNGSEKIWFWIEGVNSDKFHRSFTILPSGEFYPDCGEHWQYIQERQPVGCIN